MNKIWFCTLNLNLPVFKWSKLERTLWFLFKQIYCRYIILHVIYKHIYMQSEIGQLNNIWISLTYRKNRCNANQDLIHIPNFRHPIWRETIFKNILEKGLSYNFNYFLRHKGFCVRNLEKWPLSGAKFFSLGNR